MKNPVYFAPPCSLRTCIFHKSFLSLSSSSPNCLHKLWLAQTYRLARLSSLFICTQSFYMAYARGSWHNQIKRLWI